MSHNVSLATVTGAKLTVSGIEYPVTHLEMSNSLGGPIRLEAKANIPRDYVVTDKACRPGWITVNEGNTSDHAWVDNSPTYSAVLAARDEKHPTRSVPRMHAQRPWTPTDYIEKLMGHGCKRAGGFADSGCTATCDCHLTQAFIGPKPTRPESLNDFAAECHRDNQHWWHDPATGAKLDRNMGEMLMLVVSEIAECMEGERKGLMDTHLPHRRMAEVELADAVLRLADIVGSLGEALNIDRVIASLRDDGQENSPLPINKGEALLFVTQPIQMIRFWKGWTFHRKLARAFNRIERYAAKHGYDLWGAVAEKREYNKHRADHKPEARLAANGKKF